MTDLFISYSRRDQAVVRWLSGRLTEQGRDAWVDWEDIPPSATWMEEISAAIDAANSVVFVMSPDSLRSDVCRRELEHAVVARKRLIPLVVRDADGAPVPDALAARNWIFLRDGDDRDAAVSALVRAIDTDLDWVKQHTRLLVRANEWSGKAKDASLLLRGRDLEEAEAAVTTASDRDPAVAPVQAELVLASRQATSKRQRGIVTTAISVGVAMTLLAVFAFRQASEARKQRDTAVSRQLAAEARALVGTDPSLALVLAREAHDRKGSPETEALVRQAVADDRVLARPTSDPTSASAFAEDGKHLAWITGAKGEVHIADADGDDDDKLGEHKDANRLAWIGDKRFATASPDGSLRVWSKGNKPVTIKLGGEAAVIDGSPDGKSVAAALVDKRVLVWASSGGPPRQLGALDAKPLVVRFNATSDTVGAGDERGNFKRFRLGGGVDVDRRTPVGVTDPLTIFDVGRDLISALENTSRNILFMWCPEAEGAPLGRTNQITTRNDPASARLDAEHALVATDEGLGGVALYDADVLTGEPVRLLGFRGSINALSFSPDGARLAVGGTSGVMVFDARTRHIVKPGLGGSSTGAADLSGDGKQIAVSGYIGVSVLSAKTGKIVAETNFIEARPTTSMGESSTVQLAFSPDAKAVLVTFRDGRVESWSPSGGKTKVLARLGGEARGIAFAKKGDALVVGADGAVLAIAEDGKSRTVVKKGAFGPITSVTSDGDELVLGTTGKALIVRAKDGKLVRELEGAQGTVNAVAVSENRKFVAGAGSDGIVRLWERGSGKPAGALEGHEGEITEIAFGEDLLYSGGNDGTVRVWDPARRQALVVLRLHRGRVSALSVRGRDILSASSAFGGETVLTRCSACGKFKDVERDAAKRPGRPLTDAEKDRYGL